MHGTRHLEQSKKIDSLRLLFNKLKLIKINGILYETHFN